MIKKLTKAWSHDFYMWVTPYKVFGLFYILKLQLWNKPTKWVLRFRMPKLMYKAIKTFITFTEEEALERWGHKYLWPKNYEYVKSK